MFLTARIPSINNRASNKEKDTGSKQGYLPAVCDVQHLTDKCNSDYTWHRAARVRQPQQHAGILRAHIPVCTVQSHQRKTRDPQGKGYQGNAGDHPQVLVGKGQGTQEQGGPQKGDRLAGLTHGPHRYAPLDQPIRYLTC